MIFGKEREAVRNATRAIRDLVLRREPGQGGGFSSGLGAMAMMAMAPLKNLPEVATRVPGTLRDLGERMTAIPGARRRAPAISFAAQALAGSVRYGSTLRERYLNLLAASMDSNKAARVHPAFLEVLRQLTADEARIISQFQHDGPYPIVTVGARYKFGERLSTELRNFTLLATQAGCEYPERVSLYIDNLCRLGLVELRPTRVADDTRSFRALEEHAEVKAAVTRIESRAPALENSQSSHPQSGDDDRVVAEIRRQALYVTAFGRQFYEACEYRPEHAG
jgi:hypothetical protein